MTRDEALAHIRTYARRHAMPELDAAALILAVAVTTLQVANTHLIADTHLSNAEVDSVDDELGDELDPGKAH